jgi:hypothetical protein
MRKIGWLFGVTLLLAVDAPALAQDLAAQIKQDVEDALAPLADPAGGGGLTHGGVQVTAEGTAYVVTIADMRGAEDDSSYLDIGTVSFRLTPEGSDLYRVDDVKTPPEMPLKMADGSIDGAVTVSSQHFTGTWSRAIANFLQLDAAYRDIKVISKTDDVSIAVGEATARIDSTDKSNGRIDQAGAFRLANLNVSGPDGIYALTALEVTSTARDYNVGGWAAVQDQIQAIGANADPSAPAPAIDPQLFEALRGAAPLLSGGVTTLQVSGVSFRDPAGAEGFALPQGMFNMTLEGFDQPLGRIVLSLGHDGLAVNAADPATRDLIPHELALNVALENLPVQEIWNGAIDAFASADMSTDEGSSMAMFMLMGLVQQSLVNGKTRMGLNDWRIVSALAQAQLEGMIEASAESMFGAVGRVTLDVTGLDALIDSVRANFGADADEVAGLEVMRGFSTRQTAADGSVVDHYDMVFTPEGQFLINGKEYSFMGPMDGGTAPPPDGSSETTTGN